MNRVISPLEGEMSPKATEGVASHGVPTSYVCDKGPSPVGPTPSGRFAAISPSRGEISAPLPPYAACGSGSNAGRLVLISSEIHAAAIAVMPAIRKASS